MHRCAYAAIAMGVVLGCAGWVSAVHSAEGDAPAVAGAWTGVWSNYTPPPLDAGERGETKFDLKKPYSLKLDCKVEMLSSGKWQATFEGECGRPYKYTIKMLGRQAGNAVLFSGSADLGEKDGGVYDWIGKATETEFVGFYTSQKHTGTFRLARPAAK